MLVAERLPSMTDKEIANLVANAERLTGSAKPDQREAAEALLPLARAEQAQRAANKPAPAKRKTAPKKAAAAA